MSRPRPARGGSRAWIAAALVGLILSGCRIRSGPALEDFEPALTPGGVTTTVRTSDRVVTGELLVVRDTSLVLLLNARGPGPVIADVALASVRLAEFSGLDARIVRGSYIPEEARDRIRASSRYPQGLTPDQLSVLLAAWGQERVQRIP